jgi:Carboxymuconolactone decarboxylase family
MSRIDPLVPPYSPEVAEQLEKMMPPGVSPISLFRTFAQNLEMSRAMNGWGSYELSKRLSISLRDREILIDRVCARCRCEYEWGVHVAFFAERAELTRDQIVSLTFGTADDPCWTSDRDRLLIVCADALHDDSTIDDQLWNQLSMVFEPPQLLDITMLCGWYHAISFTANGARVDVEEAAPRFVDFAP